MAGRPRACTTLVDNILYANDILNDNATLLTLILVIQNDNLSVLYCGISLATES